MLQQAFRGLLLKLHEAWGTIRRPKGSRKVKVKAYVDPSLSGYFRCVF
jgi:hypothetical protein